MFRPRPPAERFRILSARDLAGSDEDRDLVLAIRADVGRRVREIAVGLAGEHDRVWGRFALVDSRQANEYMCGPHIDANPIGVEFDPEQWLARLRAGAPATEFLVRQSDLPISPIRGSGYQGA